MRLVRLAAATLNQTPLDWDANRRHILEAARAARAAGVGILCLPELCITGYGCEDAFLSPNTQRLALEVLGELLSESADLVMSVGLPLAHNKALFNVCALLADGQLLGFVAKRALAGDGIHYEPRWFKPWPAGKRTLVRVLGRTVPLGDLHFDVGGVKIGFEICEDAWIAERRGAELALSAVDVILNPSASHFAFGKHEIRKRVVLEGARAFGVSYVYANLVGNEAGRAIYDGDALIASAGALLACGRRFGYGDFDVLTAVVDIDLTRAQYGCLSSVVPHVESQPDECVLADFTYPTVSPEAPGLELEPWELSESLREEEFTRGIALALFDYLRKSKTRGFVVSLSGGADSAAVLSLLALMPRLAIQELGPEGFITRLGHIPGIGPAIEQRALLAKLVTCVYQSTRNSGPVTRSAARTLAEALGARHLELDLDPMVEGYVGRVEQVLGRRLSWQEDDLALQNIQARVRAPSAWLLANVLGALLLSTSNRSEAAVGYATMDGDTAGSLAPIAGIDKVFILRWLRWMEQVGPHGLGAIPALSVVNSQAPTAELRPVAAGQTDEVDLMPYSVLEVIQRAAIRDKRAPREILELLRLDFPEYSRSKLVIWLARFFRLFAQNQWKRERYAPSFHVDDANLDPKTWYRFPILSGGFERELGELGGVGEEE